MQMADVLLITSIEEGLPNVAVEAMALGLPVVSTTCGGMEELITNGTEGWLGLHESGSFSLYHC